MTCWSASCTTSEENPGSEASNSQLRYSNELPPVFLEKTEQSPEHEMSADWITMSLFFFFNSKLKLPWESV